MAKVTAIQFPKGTIVRTIVAVRDLPVGTVGEVIQNSNGQLMISTGNGLWLYPYQVELAYLTVDGLEEGLKEAAGKVDEYKQKIAYMKEMKPEKFNENEYRVFTALRAINNKKMSESERITVIANLLN